MNAPEKAVMYCRVSTEKQKEHGFSIDSQLQYLRDYAKKNNLILVQEFVTAESAKGEGRKVFNQMFEFVKKNKIKNIICEKTDRFLRNLKDNIQTGELIKDHEVMIHLTQEGLKIHKASPANDLLMFDLFSVFAKNFIDRHREVVVDRSKMAASKGRFCHVPPFGYKYIHGEITIIPDQARTVQRVYELYLDKVSSQKIADLFNINRQQIFKILKNPFYIGMFRSYGKVWDGTHEPLIDLETFQRAQAMLLGKQTNHKRLRTNYAYSGHIKCAHCGRVLVASLKKEKYVYYECSGKFRNKCDNTKALSEPKIKEYIIEILKQLHMTDEEHAKLKEIANKYKLIQHNHVKEALQDIQNKIDLCRKRIASVEKKWVDEKISDERYEALTAEYLGDKEDAELQEKKLQEVNAQTHLDLQYFVKFVGNLHKMALVFEKPESIVRIAKLVTGNLIWDGEKLDHTWANPVSVVFKVKDCNRWYSIDASTGKYAELIALWQDLSEETILFQSALNNLLAA